MANKMEAQGSFPSFPSVGSSCQHLLLHDPFIMIEEEGCFLLLDDKRPNR